MAAIRLERTRTSARFHTRRSISRLSFCEVQPLSQRDIEAAEADHLVKAPVRAKIVLPLQVVPNLIAALQEHLRVYSESTGTGWDKGPIH